MIVSTTSQMLAQIGVQTIGDSGSFSLPVGPFGQLTAVVDHFDREGERLSIVGRVFDSKDSELMLKIDRKGVYGWVADRDQDIAFEFTTDAQANVLVEQVPVSEVLHVCDFEMPDELQVPEPAMQLTYPGPGMQLTSAELPLHIGEYDGSDVTKLQSLPGAEKVWYIDLTDVMNGSTPIGQSEEDVWQTWQALASTLSMFEINVTTDPDVYEAAGVANSGIAEMRDIDEGSSYCGLNTFGSRSACVIHRYQNGYATGRILAHEVGHGLGMRHDGGDNGGEYFNGFSDFQWTPLMGNVWPGNRWMNALYQWSKGEYESATQQEDDLSHIERHVDYREDDIPEDVPLKIEGTSVSLDSNWGQIGANTDTDSFTFSIGSEGGRASLRIDRIEYIGGGMLDVDASIIDGEGEVVAQNNVEVARHAELDVELEAGDYTLLIQGGEEGTLARGFTRYSSLGFYGIEGSITGAVGGGTEGMGGSAGTGGMAGAASGGTGGTAGAAAGGGTGGMAGFAGSDRGGSAGTSGSMPSAGVAGAESSGGPSAGGEGLGGPAAGGQGASGTVPTLGAPVADSSGCACAVPASRQLSGNWWSIVAVAGLLYRRRRPRG